MDESAERGAGKPRRRAGRKFKTEEEKVKGIRMWIPYRTEEEHDRLLRVPAEVRRQLFLEWLDKKGW